jgi:hypothetical protein
MPAECVAVGAFRPHCSPNMRRLKQPGIFMRGPNVRSGVLVSRETPRCRADSRTTDLTTRASTSVAVWRNLSELGVHYQPRGRLPMQRVRPARRSSQCLARSRRRRVRSSCVVRWRQTARFGAHRRRNKSTIVDADRVFEP